MSDIYARGLRDENFVSNAFRALLQRDPTGVELKGCMSALSAGDERFAIIVSVALSPEFEDILTASPRLKRYPPIRVLPKDARVGAAATLP